MTPSLCEERMVTRGVMTSVTTIWTSSGHTSRVNMNISTENLDAHLLRSKKCFWLFMYYVGSHVPFMICNSLIIDDVNDT